MTTQAAGNNVSAFTNDELHKELAFARGFGAYDELSGNWLDALEAEAAQRNSQTGTQLAEGD